MVAKAGVEPTTLRLKVIVSTKAPPRPTLKQNIVSVATALYIVSALGPWNVDFYVNEGNWVPWPDYHVHWILFREDLSPASDVLCKCWNSFKARTSIPAIHQVLREYIEYYGAWWLGGMFDALGPEGHRFESQSSHHIGTLGKSFTLSCLWCFGMKFRHSIRAVLGAPLSSSRLQEVLKKYPELMNDWKSRLLLFCWDKISE